MKILRRTHAMMMRLDRALERATAPLRGYIADRVDDQKFGEGMPFESIDSPAEQQLLADVKELSSKAGIAPPKLALRWAGGDMEAGYRKIGVCFASMIGHNNDSLKSLAAHEIGHVKHGDRINDKGRVHKHGSKWRHLMELRADRTAFQIHGADKMEALWVKVRDKLERYGDAEDRKEIDEGSESHPSLNARIEKARNWTRRENKQKNLEDQGR